MNGRIEIGQPIKSGMHLYWVDKYSKGYRTGVSHASIDDSGKTLCGKLITSGWDGGYEAVGEYSEVECLKCLKKITPSKPTTKTKSTN